MVKLHYLQESDFWDDLNNKKYELILEVVNTIINAIETNSRKSKIKIFEVAIMDDYILDFAIVKKEYFDVLKNLLPDMIKNEQYEICNKIKIICGL